MVLAMLSALTYGCADYSGGRASRAMASTVVTAVGQGVSLLLVAAAVLAIGTPLASGADLGWGALGGLAGALGLMCFYHALGHGAVTVVAPITAVVGVLIPVIVGVALGDRPRPWGWAGMALAVVAVALVSGALGGGGGGLRTPVRIVGLSIAAGCGFGVIFAALAQTSDDAGLWPLVSARVVSVPVVAAVVLATRPPIAAGRSSWLVAVLAGVLDMTANLLYLEAAQRGSLSSVAVVSSLYPVSTVALAFLLDHERAARSQLTGMAAAVAALVLVSANA
jgi:uncharacterized membrane protein